MVTQSKGYVDKSWNIGMQRVDKIIDQEKASGFEAWSSGIYSNLPDIIVISKEMNLALDSSFDAIVRVYEVTNYGSPDEYIQLDRAKRYRDTLLQFKAEKVFVCSYEENLRYLLGGKDFFEQCGIKVHVVGYQD